MGAERRLRTWSTAVRSIVVVTCLVAVGATPAIASAQARNLTVIVRTYPDEPRANETVHAFVNISGCPPGDVTAELYYVPAVGFDGTDGEVPATMINRAAAVTTLLYRTKAVISAEHAAAGWYGIRALCGTFRPPREPMTNTWFEVR
ncbi:MAG: hypothetical protein R2698_06250 [Microthrixaceae bacterium]